MRALTLYPLAFLFKMEEVHEGQPHLLLPPEGGVGAGVVGAGVVGAGVVGAGVVGAGVVGAGTGEVGVLPFAHLMEISAQFQNCSGCPAPVGL